MDGQANWVMGIVIVAGLLGIMLLVGYSRSVFQRFQSRHAVVACPETGASTDIIVETDIAKVETGKPARKVVSCSRFEDRSKVDCDQRCLHQLK